MTPSRKRAVSRLSLDHFPLENIDLESCDDSTPDNFDDDSVTGKVEIKSSKYSRKKPKLSEDPLPDPFVLPENYRPDVEVALKTGQMTTETKKAYISQVPAAMFAKKHYPTRDEFQRVALDVIQKYPFLPSPVSGSTKTVCE